MADFESFRELYHAKLMPSIVLRVRPDSLRDRRVPGEHRRKLGALAFLGVQANHLRHLCSTHAKCEECILECTNSLQNRVRSIAEWTSLVEHKALDVIGGNSQGKQCI